MTLPGVEFELFTSSFCGACARTRGVLASALRYLPGATIAEHAVESEPDLAEAAGIEATPTVILRDRAGTELFRATGVPTIHQVLTAAVRATDQVPNEPAHEHPREAARPAVPVIASRPGAP